MVADDVHHDRTFWGIRFPVRTPSFDKTAIDMIEEYLEGSGNAMLDTYLQGLDQAVVLNAVEPEVDGEFIKHKIVFSNYPIE